MINSLPKQPTVPEMPEFNNQIIALPESVLQEDTQPAQIIIKNCHDCTINIYPSQVFNRGNEDE